MRVDGALHGQRPPVVPLLHDVDGVAARPLHEVHEDVGRDQADRQRRRLQQFPAAAAARR